MPKFFYPHFLVLGAELGPMAIILACNSGCNSRLDWPIGTKLCTHNKAHIKTAKIWQKFDNGFWPFFGLLRVKTTSDRVDHIMKNDQRKILHQMAYSTKNSKISRFAIIILYYLDCSWKQIQVHSSVSWGILLCLQSLVPVGQSGLESQPEHGFDLFGHFQAL